MLSEYQLHSKYLAVIDLKYALRFSLSRHLQWSLEHSFSLVNLLVIYLNLPTVNISGVVSLYLWINKICTVGKRPIIDLNHPDLFGQ